ETSQLLDLVGDTPLVKIRSNIFAKLEATNPSGSIKDRMALYMLETAEKNNEIRPGYKIIEATSGNTGISFAMIAALKGYDFTAIMSETMSAERRQIMRAYGANFVLTPTTEDAVKKLEEFRTKENVWLPRQFDNQANVDCHRETTGKEIVQQLDKIGAIVAGVGTGGTLMGIAEALIKEFPNVKVVAVEPDECAVLSGREAGMHKIQGIGPGFIPSIVDMSRIDEVVAVKGDQAIEMTRELALENGFLVGISSGANVLASLKIAKKMPNSNIVTILPDSANRYLSTGLF
ncbi:MAG: cysteine synthase A, partial [Promethearchaeota archaeon]